jgi:hypothetical protein
VCFNAGTLVPRFKDTAKFQLKFLREISAKPGFSRTRRDKKNTSDCSGFSTRRILDKSSQCRCGFFSVKREFAPAA